MKVAAVFSLFAAFLFLMGPVWAASTSTGGKAPATTTPHAQTSGSAAPETKATVVGKVETHNMRDKKGKEVRVGHLTVSQATKEGGQSLDKMKGKSLRLTGPQAAEAEKHAGKEVEVMGTIIGTNRLRVDSVKERPTTTAQSTTPGR